MVSVDGNITFNDGNVWRLLIISLSDDTLGQPCSGLMKAITFVADNSEKLKIQNKALFGHRKNRYSNIKILYLPHAGVFILHEFVD